MEKIIPVQCETAPKALGNYSHAVCYAGLVFVSGIASRNPQTNEVPGLILNDKGEKVSYDIRAETKGTLENIGRILKSAGSSFAHVLDVTVFLLEMKDFSAYNEVYSDFFREHRPARTTIGVASLPGNISIEIKLTAAKP